MLTFFSWVLLFLPWGSLLFVDRRNVKRYMPVVLFTTLLMCIFFLIGYSLKWWTILNVILPFGHITDVPFLLGIFPVGTFWIFYLTSHRIWLYAAVNLGVNLFFAFGMIPILERVGIMRLERMPAWLGFVISIALAAVIYVYHRWQLEVLTPPVHNRDKRSTRGGRRMLSSLQLVRFFRDRGDKAR